MFFLNFFIFLLWAIEAFLFQKNLKWISYCILDCKIFISVPEIKY